MDGGPKEALARRRGRGPTEGPFKTRRAAGWGLTVLGGGGSHLMDNRLRAMGVKAEVHFVREIRGRTAKRTTSAKTKGAGKALITKANSSGHWHQKVGKAGP